MLQSLTCVTVTQENMSKTVEMNFCDNFMKSIKIAAEVVWTFFQLGFQVGIQFIFFCPGHISKTIRGIGLKLGRCIDVDEGKCSVHEP